MARIVTPRRITVTALLAAALLGLLLHAREYAFLCDDAFISFRYAVNLADGHGLVFNAGGDRVEGYTNFLWVVVLAAGRVLGVAPEDAANPLLLLATIGLWGLTAWFAWRQGRGSPVWWPSLAPPILLAATRSVAVWSSSGLETRLFEVLTLAAALRLCVEVERALRGDVTVAPVSGVLFALATLTRPDAVLISAASLGAGVAWLGLRRRLAGRYVWIQALTYGTIVGVHIAWRRAYYGAWLPNTFYAKVGGTWWEMGRAYLGSFFLEYAVWLWIPLIAAGMIWNARRGTGHVPLIFGAAVLPHLLYVASIGGDHFEYRPLDLYFPFAYLLAANGLRLGTERIRGPAAACVPLYLALVLWGVLWLPWRSHLRFPEEYLAGFPGLQPALASAEAFLDPVRDPVYRLPGLRTLGETYQRLVRETTARFVGIRQESHRQYLAMAADEGRALRALVAQGWIGPDTYIATDCAGAIPYYSRLRMLDRLGLNDAYVARSGSAGPRRIAHEKRATLEYAEDRGVDLWAQDRVHFVLPLAGPRVRSIFDAAVRFQDNVYFAELPDDRVLVAKLPSGIDSARARFPRLAFRSAREEEFATSFRRRLIEAGSARLDAAPDTSESRMARADLLAFAGRLDAALATYLSIPDDGEALYRAGVILVALGRHDEAVGALEGAVRSRPRFGYAWQELGKAYSGLGRATDAVAALRRAVELMPEKVQTHFDLGVACVAAGDERCVDEEIAFLHGVGTGRANFLASSLTRRR